MADGLYYVDSRQPFTSVAQSAVTLAATDKLIHPAALTILPANYFTVGKALRLTIYGTITTAATPGNLGVELYYGSTDAGTTLLASSVVQTLIASQTTAPFIAKAYCRCRAIGATTGSLIAWGIMNFVPTVIAVGTFLTPGTAPAAVTIDTTVATGGLNIQFKRSGSTAETVTVHDIIYEALN